jgi:hypothetical protein
MTSRTSFYRKIMYLAAIGLLLIPLYLLSHPATNAIKGAQGSPGGVLAQLRDEYHLSQAQIGQIDPTSVTVKLVTLGLRGVAANILWEKAIDFKMKKDWTNFGATLNQITKIQPNFIKVWINQAWNLAYNCSVEFDDYRQRYQWVIKGIDFLKEGIKYNQRQPRLLWDMGWTISQKIGKADEHKQFRKLFKEDDDFNANVPIAQRDNWLVGKKRYDDAIAMVDSGAPMMEKSPLIYRSNGPMCQMSYAEYLEKDGTFGEVAKQAWKDAAKDWERYGADQIPTSYQDEKTDKPVVIRLGEEELMIQNAKKFVAQLDALEPGLREKLLAKKRAALTPAQLKAIEIPFEKRTPKQNEIAYQAQDSLIVTHNEVARAVKGPKREEALKLAKDAANCEALADYIHRYRDIVNFVYWRLRADVEQTDPMITARKLLNQGDRAYAEGDQLAARSAYEQSFKIWRKIFDQNPTLVPDVATGEDLLDIIKRYRRILSQLDEPFPEKFVLQDVLDAHPQNQAAPPPKKADKK